jgi:hypothetical protein
MYITLEKIFSKKTPGRKKFLLKKLWENLFVVASEQG